MLKMQGILTTIGQIIECTAILETDFIGCSTLPISLHVLEGSAL